MMTLHTLLGAYMIIGMTMATIHEAGFITGNCVFPSFQRMAITCMTWPFQLLFMFLGAIYVLFTYDPLIERSRRRKANADEQ